MRHCAKCNSLMPDDAACCIRCGCQSTIAPSRTVSGPQDAKSIASEGIAQPREVKWARVSAAVLTSKLFFLASCTGGMALGLSAIDGVESGSHGGHERPLDPLMSVVAVVPMTGKPGGREVVGVSLINLETFRRDNPGVSFLPPLGAGEVSDPAGLARTAYTVTAAGPDKVVVETRLEQNDNHVLGRYEAMEKGIKPLYSKTSNDLVDFMMGMSVGLPLALVLALLGHILKRHAQITASRRQTRRPPP
jgi:hypothetical protein